MRKKRILVVDDEPSILEIVDILLSTEGYEVIKASNGQEAVDSAKRYYPDAIILDVMMPKMSGYMVATLISQDKYLKTIPVMLLTATAQVAGNITLEMPTPYRLSKPFRPETLLEMIRKMILESSVKKSPN